MNKILSFFLFLYMSVLLLIGGCNPTNDLPLIARDYYAKKDIKDIIQITEDNINEMGEISKNIYSQSVNIIKKNTIIKEINKEEKINNLANDAIIYATIIKDKTKELDDVGNNFKLSQSRLKILSNKVEEINKNSQILIVERDKAIKRQNELETEIRTHIQILLKWIIGGCVIGIGLFGALAAFGNIKGGLFGATSCGITLVMAAVVGENLAILGYIGLVIIVFGIGLVIYRIYIQTKATNQIIETTEKAKENMTNEAKEKVFGGYKDNGMARTLQSKTTELLVKKQKNKLKKKNGKS